MTPSEIASQLHGSEYPLRLGPADIEGLRSHGLVVAMGASDDILEFEGAIREEINAIDGGYAYVDQQGILPAREDIDDDDILRDFFDRQPLAHKITAHWNEDGSAPAWTVTTTIPHATFDVMEDGEVFCRGIVFRLADIPTSQ